LPTDRHILSTLLASLYRSGVLNIVACFALLAYFLGFLTALDARSAELSSAFFAVQLCLVHVFHAHGASEPLIASCVTFCVVYCRCDLLLSLRITTSEVLTCLNLLFYPHVYCCIFLITVPALREAVVCPVFNLVDFRAVGALPLSLVKINLGSSFQLDLRLDESFSVWVFCLTYFTGCVLQICVIESLDFVNHCACFASPFIW